MSTRAHVFVFLVTVAALFFILRLVRRRQLRAKYAMLWVSVGLVLAVLATFPVLANKSAELVGVDYQPAALLFGAVAFLFLLVVHFSWELSRLEDRSRIAAEELAMLRNRVELLELDVAARFEDPTDPSTDPVTDPGATDTPR